MIIEPKTEDRRGNQEKKVFKVFYKGGYFENETNR